MDEILFFFDYQFKNACWQSNGFVQHRQPCAPLHASTGYFAGVPASGTETPAAFWQSTAKMSVE
jgi:hypothetical protein